LLAAYTDAPGAALLPKVDDRYDAAVALRLHHAKLVLHAEKRAEHVGIEGRGIAFGGLLRHWAWLALGAGIVDGHIQAAKALHGAIDKIAHVVFMAHVGVHELGLGAQLAQFGGQGLASVIAAAGHNDAGSFVSESEGRGTSDAGERAGDEDNWAVHMSTPLEVTDVLK
jgi:hypothetical protein